MMKRVARFKDLKGFDGGLPDSKMPGCERTLFNVIGFQPPDGWRRERDLAGRRRCRAAWPRSRSAKASTSATARPSPATGPMMHNHDTNETFIPMTGTWRASWEDENGKVEYVDLGPMDVVSFPPGMIRRFENVTKGDPNAESILMFVIGGDAPQAEFTDQAIDAVVKPPACGRRQRTERRAPMFAGHLGTGDGGAVRRRRDLCQCRRAAGAARRSTIRRC